MKKLIIHFFSPTHTIEADKCVRLTPNLTQLHHCMWFHSIKDIYNVSIVVFLLIKLWRHINKFILTSFLKVFYESAHFCKRIVLNWISLRWRRSEERNKLIAPSSTMLTTMTAAAVSKGHFWLRKLKIKRKKCTF